MIPQHDVLDGRYRVIRPIGSGAMASVFLCEDLLLRRQVALKQLEFGASEADLELFRRETAATHAITHPNVARTYDIGQADNRHYISMEWLDGETLMQRIRRQPLTAQEVRQMAVPLCQGLNAAHQAGVVHRDLKPANIMLVGDGRHVVVMDFGIAGQVGSVSAGDLPDGGDQVSPWGVTSAGRGTPAYMAPEQWRQEGGDARTDIYALGVILYVSLTVKSPFVANSIDDLQRAHLDTPAPDVRAIAPAVDAELAGLIRACMAKEPADRPPTMGAVIDTLEGPQRRRKWLKGLLTAGALAATMAIALNAGLFAVAKTALLHQVRPAVERLARLVASDLPAADLRAVTGPEAMKTAPFQRLLKVVKGFRAESADTKAVYVLRATPTPNRFVFVLDDRPDDHDDDGDGVISPKEQGSPPGLPYDGTNFPGMARTLRTGAPQADDVFGRDQWGVTLSGYAPIRDAAGAPTDMFVGVDVGNEQLNRLAAGLRWVLFVGFALLWLLYAIASSPVAGGGTRWVRWLGRSE